MKNLIRVARIEDAKTLLEIYAPYVLHTAISFEYEVPSLEEFEERMRNVLCKYPYLVAERDGEIVGYAYAGPLKTRAAYDWAVETTIYVRKDVKKSGLGKELYHALENALALQNILNLNACIGYPEVEDEYLTKNSVQFHEHLGYRFVGEFYQCGYKFKRWYNMVWMEKQLGEHKEVPLPVKRFDEIRGELEKQYGIS
ncbi:MAG: GNAT family N-acetyltransferase [bacterium]|nr:GNAT family N-acetyltransferase [bacterium]